jgi:spore coat polysaccharide biosynthesis predicted glycosyltransferase SpsG
LRLNIEEVLITFGGTDPNNLTHKVVRAIYEYCSENNIQITVINGFGYMHYETLKEFEKVSVLKDVKNISDYMTKADICFSSAGRTTYELALLGVPTIVLAQNDREMTHFFCYESNGFKNLGLGKDVDINNISEAFQDIVASYELRKKMQKLMLQNDIRGGKKRVINLINQLIAE